MAFKYALVCIFAFILIIQLTVAAPAPDAPAAPATDDQSGKLEDALNSVKTQIDTIVKSVQDSDMLKQLGEMFQKFGDDVSQQTQQLVKNIQTSATTASS